MGCHIKPRTQYDEVCPGVKPLRISFSKLTTSFVRTRIIAKYDIQVTGWRVDLPPDHPKLRQSLHEFKRWYNQREHESLGWKTPEECYKIEPASF